MDMFLSLVPIQVFFLVAHRLSFLDSLSIGLFILSGKEIKSDSITSFNSLEDAIRWKGTGKLILCTSDDESALERVSAFDTDFFSLASCSSKSQAY